MESLENVKQIAVRAKHLFVHACSHAAGQSDIERIIALHDMHNALEWILSGLWGYYFGAQDKPWGFMKLFDRISDQKQRLMLRREVEMINNARNQAQHHAIPPTSDALQKYMGYCESFFRQTLRDLAADCEYDNLFMGLLLPADLDFRVQSDCFPEKLLEWLSGRIEEVGVDPVSCQPQRHVDLNLREMFMEAEKRRGELVDCSEDEKWELRRSAVNILAACLLYARHLAIIGLGLEPPLATAYDIGDPNWEPVRATDMTLYEYITLRADYIDIFSTDFLLGYAKIVRDNDWAKVGGNIPHFLTMEVMNHGIALRQLATGLRNVMAAALLGTDLKKMQYFRSLYTVANSRRGRAGNPVGLAPTQPSAELDRLSGKDFDNLDSCLHRVDQDDHLTPEPPFDWASYPVFVDADLLWCQEFVLQTLLDLAPCIRSTPCHSRIFAERKTRLGYIQVYNAFETELPF